jgi:alpha-galactosidase
MRSIVCQEERMKHEEDVRKAHEQLAEIAGNDVTRRSFLRSGAAAIGGFAVVQGSTPSHAEKPISPSAVPAGKTQHGTGMQQPSSFLNLLRTPDAVTAFARFQRTLPEGMIPLQRSGSSWTNQHVAVESILERKALVLALTAPSATIAAVHVRWNTKVSPQLQVLGDAWERSYGDLGWRNLIPERGMPWYFATYDEISCHGYGVKTDARALCFWQLDQDGVSLWLNVSNGGNGVELGERSLTMATVVAHHGAAGMEAIDSVGALCRSMCARTSRPTTPIYGANDWCYSYGQSTAETILRDTEFIAGLAPSGSVSPFSVIDGGWSEGTASWPDMGKLAGAIKQRTVRPGLWIRPLEAPKDAARGLLLPDARFGQQKVRARELAYDPTIPEARAKILAKMRQTVDWGYEMVKHDFSTYDLLGQWGFEMGPQPTLPGWSLNDRSRTNAEVIADLYRQLRTEAGDRVLLDGCNTIGHLGQGIFDVQRTGDDTSGRHWERTRRMGVNTAAFRLPQNGTFFTVDADLIAITDAIPWELSRQWLDLVARSGTATLVSAAPSARAGQEQQAALREAFRIAAGGGAGAKPIDWLQTSTPEHWRSTEGAEERHYRWSGVDGVSPFLSQ